MSVARAKPLIHEIKDGEEQSANVLALTYPSTNESVVPNVVPQKLLSKTSGDQAENVRKLERQIIFLKEEHQSMLRALQIEVDLLKQKNKDLHFHIVMQNLSSKLSESCEELKDVRVVQGSPQQMENLEAKIKALSAELHEVQSRNLYLSSIIEEQKQKLLEIETKESSSTLIQSPLPSGFRRSAKRDGNLESEDEEYIGKSATDRNVGEEEEEFEETEDLSLSLPSTPTIPTPVPPQEYLQKLQEANLLIETLKNENQVQRREILEIKSTIDKGTKLRFKGCNHPTRLLSRAQRQPEMGQSSSFMRGPQGTWGKGSSVTLPRRGSRTQMKDALPPLDHTERHSKRNVHHVPSELPPVSYMGSNHQHSHSQFPLNLVSFPERRPTRDLAVDSPHEHLDAGRKKKEFPSLRNKSVPRTLNLHDMSRRNSTTNKSLRNFK